MYWEDAGRKFEEQGRDIGKGNHQVTERDRIYGARRRKAKEGVLQMQLEIREITLVLLPAGMERKKSNKSFWDSKLRPSPF